MGNCQQQFGCRCKTLVFAPVWLQSEAGQPGNPLLGTVLPQGYLLIVFNGLLVTGKAREQPC